MGAKRPTPGPARLGGMPGWLLDLGIALLLGGGALLLERLTEGRLPSRDVFLFVGAGTFLLLRAGARLARAGRTLGCLFVGGVTWLLPCAGALFLTVDGDRRAIVRDSLPLFMVVALFLILVMVLTFERMRVADERRHARSTGAAPSREPPAT